MTKADGGDAKQAARIKAYARRAGLDPDSGAELGRHLLAAFSWPAGTAIAGFWPVPGEIDIRPLLHDLHRSGHAILLPHTPPRGNPLIFRHWHPASTMLAERFGTSRPDGPVGTPQILLVPLLAFDRRGHRLGYGGGYYDRTLAAMPHATAIGCAYAAQEVDSVPTGPYDASLHAVATERGVVLMEKP